MSSQGITEVPTRIDPGDPLFRRMLTELRSTVLELRSGLAPLTNPTNFKGTALSFGVLLQWTRVPNADGYEILWNMSPSLSGATVVDVGNSPQWQDNVGNTNITKFYWVRAYRRSNGIRSAESGPQKVTTLASGTGVNVPIPPPPSSILVVDQNTGHVIPYILATGAPPGRVQT